MQLLKIEDLKPLGAFLEYTIRPLLNELKDSGIDIKVINLEKTIHKLVITHVISTFIGAVRDIVVVFIIAYIVCKI